MGMSTLMAMFIRGHLSPIATTLRNISIFKVMMNHGSKPSIDSVDFWIWEDSEIKCCCDIPPKRPASGAHLLLSTASDRNFMCCHYAGIMMYFMISCVAK